MKNKILILFLLIFFISFSSAQTIQTLGYFKQKTNVQLIQTCSTCTYNNISSAQYPNLTTIFSNVAMTQSGATFSYTLISNYTQDFGRYIVCGFGDPSGTKTTWCYDLYINATGRPEPSGSVLTFFIIAFLVVLLMLVSVFIYSIGHGIKKDFDIMDLAYCFGLYFMILGLYFVQQQYIGNPLMENILYVLFYVGGFTHIFLPAIFFFISMLRSSVEQSQRDMGVRI